MQKNDQGHARSDGALDVLEYHIRYRDGERIKYLPYRPGLIVLDCRCGQGLLLDQLEGWAGVAWGIDRSPTSLLPNLQLQRVAVAAVGSLPFADGAFNAVLCEHVLRRRADLGHVLGEMARVLCPEGRLILWESRRSLGGTNSVSLERAMQRAGLALICQEPFDYMAYPVAALTNEIPLVRRSSLAMRVVQGFFALDVLLARLPALRSRSWHTISVLEKHYVRSSNA